MNEINTEFLKKSIDTLDRSYEFLIKSDSNSIEYEIYRNSTVKCFEVVLEQAGKLLRKKIREYMSSNKEADKLSYKDIFRQAFKQGILEEDFVVRWFDYRDNRNDTSHDYGESFAEDTVGLLPQFIIDSKQLLSIIKND